jgi:hypothetical protein
MSIRSLSIPDKKLSVVIYAKTTNVQSATSDELISETADISTINCENVSTNNIYATSINELDLSLDLMPTTIGAPNQVLSRAPNFNPEDPETFKTVWQTVGGGGGGNVNNPMTEDLNANNNKITNLSEITGVEGVLKTSLIDVQNNDIYHVNELKGRSDDNKLYISGNVEILENLDMTEQNINNCNIIETRTLTSLANFISCLKELNMYAPINMRDNSIFNADKLTGRYLGVDLNLDMIPATQGVASQVLARSPVYDPNNPATYKLVWQTPSSGGGGVQNPMNTILNCNGYGLVNVSSLTSQNSGAFNIALNGNILSTVGNSLSGITSVSGFNGSMTLNGDIKAEGNMTFGANKQLKISLVSAEGIGALDTQLVLIGRNPTNQPVPISISASDIFLNNQFDTSPLPQTLVHLNGSLAVNTIKPYDNTTFVRLTAPTIQLDNTSGAVNETSVYLSGNLTFNNPVSNAYISGRNLNIYSRTGTPSVNTPINISSSICTIAQDTLNLTSSTSNNITGTTNFNSTTNFIGALKTNTIDTYTGTDISVIQNLTVESAKNLKTNTIDATTGDTVSVLQNLTLSTGRQLRTDLVFSSGLRSYSNADLVIAGLMPDNKAQTNIILASPQISLNNQYGTSTQETRVNIAGNIIFNNPITEPYINGSNLSIRGRTTTGVPTFLGLEGSSISLSASSNININGGAINMIKNINLLSNRGVDINPPMVLYRTVGAPSSAFNITNGATYVNVTNGQTSKGSKTIPANGLIANDLYKFSLSGLMTCDAKIDMTFSIYTGSTRICTFTLAGDALTNQGFEFTTTLSVIQVSATIVSLATGIGKFEKDGKSASYAVPVVNANLFTNVANTFDIYIKPVSTMVTGSVTIYNFSIENI